MKKQYYVGIGRMNGRPLDIVIASVSGSKSVAEGVTKHKNTVIEWHFGPGVVDGREKLAEVVALLVTHSVPKVPAIWFPT